MEKIYFDSVDRLLCINNALNEMFFGSILEQEDSKTDSPPYKIPENMLGVKSVNDILKQDYPAKLSEPAKATGKSPIQAAKSRQIGSFLSLPQEAQDWVRTHWGDPSNPLYWESEYQFTQDPSRTSMTQDSPDNKPTIVFGHDINSPQEFSRTRDDMINYNQLMQTARGIPENEIRKLYDKLKADVKARLDSESNKKELTPREEVERDMAIQSEEQRKKHIEKLYSKPPVIDQVIKTATENPDRIHRAADAKTATLEFRREKGTSTTLFPTYPMPSSIKDKFDVMQKSGDITPEIRKNIEQFYLGNMIAKAHTLPETGTKFA